MSDKLLQETLELVVVSAVSLDIYPRLTLKRSTSLIAAYGRNCVCFT